MSTAPDALPPTIVQFLSDSVGIAESAVETCWDLLKDDIWQLPETPLTEQEETAFRNYGWKCGLTLLTLYPPSHHCTNKDCPHTKPLKKEDGVVPAWATYYGGLPQYVQVGKHQFVEQRVIKMWISMMLVGWFSATNCACAYDMALSHGARRWQFGVLLQTEHVWDAFVVWTLLVDHDKSNVCLEVPHTGLQKDRFTEKMAARNKHVILHGQDEVPHYCNKCMRVIKQEDGSLAKCQVVVSDGLTLGHPSCGVFCCTNPLANNRLQFCPIHDELHHICAITGCNSPVVPGTKSCLNDNHQKMERLHYEKGKAAFTHKERLQQQHVLHPNNSMADSADTNPDAVPNDLEENLEWFEVKDGEVHIQTAKNPGSVGVAEDNKEEEVCEARKSPTGNKKIKCQFGRRRTHNEQTLVCPCGVIVARATFFGAEAVSNVLLFVKNMFSYDTNCNAKQQVMARGDPFFEQIGMCGDVWHFLNKHQVTHVFCQEHCNPANYPELMGPDGTSAKPPGLWGCLWCL
ncbi:hypothetical protein B0H34DRAFT_779819 [Crassisporium funariophilum]|nr:hypothetical protein B0H34DRAFT_779819 [Crassisporium funariophilum]